MSEVLQMLTKFTIQLTILSLIHKTTSPVWFLLTIYLQTYFVRSVSKGYIRWLFQSKNDTLISVIYFNIYSNVFLFKFWNSKIKPYFLMILFIEINFIYIVYI